MEIIPDTGWCITWWIVPLLITVGLFVWADKAADAERGGFLDFSGFYYVFVLIPVLIVWLVYFVQATWTGAW